MNVRQRIRRAIRDPHDKRRYVQGLFGRIAGRYDLTNDVMSLGLHRRWKARLLKLSELEPHHRVLDLAAGTGDLALRARRRMGEGDGVVVAADLTPEMLTSGRERRGGEEVEWLRGDALKLPFAARSFDRVLIGYGLRNFSDLPASLREIRRCLKPGGWLMTLDFGKPPVRWLRRLYLRYLELSTGVVGWLLHRDPEAYLYIPESLRRYPAQGDVRSVMERVGFRTSGWIDLLGGVMAIHFAQRPDA